jgi:dihydroflavonol-4-reductase
MNPITGGAGFIGSHLVAAPLDEGEDVHVLKCRRGQLRPPAAGWYRTGQRRLPRPSSHGLGNTRLQPCLSFGGRSDLWRRNLREYDAVNYQGALNVAHAALDNGAKRVLHTSAESILTLAAIRLTTR